MSENLRKLASKLLKLLKLRASEVRLILRTAPKRLVNVLAEIAYNAREGVLKVSAKFRNSKLITTLADKKAKYKVKQQILRKAAAALTVKTLLKASSEILKALGDG